MKTIPSGLLTHLQSGGTTTAFGLKITRRDLTVYGVTSADKDVTISGVRYYSAPGLDVASLVSTAGFAVDNTEITILADDTLVKKTDVLAGRWDGASFELFRYNWATPTNGRDVVKVGTFGNFMPRRGSFVAEMRGLRQALQQTVGSIIQPTCRYRLGSTAMPDGLCLKDLTAFTYTGSVTSTVSQYQFRDTTKNQAADWFADGTVTWLTGLNAGIQSKVRTSAATGHITLSMPLIFAVQVGDTYRIVAGCLKRLSEDCKTKFDNVLNFGGEPHLPGQDQLSAPASFST